MKPRVELGDAISFLQCGGFDENDKLQLQKWDRRGAELHHVTDNC